MLTERHLAVVRAALKFLDEEMSPSGPASLFHYLDHQSRTSGVSIEDINVTRDLFDKVDLFYILVDSAGIVVDSNRLIAAGSNDEVNFQSDLSVLASVLMPIQ